MNYALTPNIDAVASRVVERAPSRAAAQRAVTSLVSSRQRQELEARQIEKSIHRLAALGVPQRDIAALAGLSQAEISRRLKRANLSPGIERIHEIVLQRADGRLTSAEMIEALAAAVGSRRKPGRISAYDNISTSSRTVAEIMKLYKSGAISKREYDGVRARLANAGKPVDRPS